MIKSNKQVFSFQLPTKLKEKIEVAAQEDYSNVSEWIREAIRQKLERKENGNDS